MPDAAARPTSYSTVIVTRNRPAALELSLPLQLRQSRLPQRIAVIDSSDDPSENKAFLNRLADTTKIPILHVTSAPGMTLQRNIGLQHVESDVTFFPDDDSLVHPDALAAIMSVYDQDAEGRVGGVGGIETRHAPEGALSPQANAYRQRPSDRLKARFARARARIENRYVPDPMKLAARRLQRSMGPPEPWLALHDATRVEWITGFRMSFRTDLIRQVRFNENLGRYALFEDIDAGFGVMMKGKSLVASHKAMIYHHKSPERRANGRELGVMQILNRAYVVCRSGPVDAQLRQATKRYARYKAFQYGLGAATSFERERLAGARAALQVLDELCDADRASLDATYLSLRARCLDAQ